MRKFKIALSQGYSVFKYEVKAAGIIESIQAAKDKHEGRGFKADSFEVLSSVMWSK